jgi:hypothetical protein
MPGVTKVPGLMHRTGVALLCHGARAHLARTRPRVVAITGTQGKTVMKCTLSELLASRLRVRAKALLQHGDRGSPRRYIGKKSSTGGVTSDSDRNGIQRSVIATLLPSGGAQRGPELCVVSMNFGPLSGDLLVGNFGNGMIHAYHQ